MKYKLILSTGLAISLFFLSGAGSRTIVLDAIRKVPICFTKIGAENNIRYKIYKDRRSSFIVPADFNCEIYDDDKVWIDVFKSIDRLHKAAWEIKTGDLINTGYPLALIKKKFLGYSLGIPEKAVTFKFLLRKIFLERKERVLISVVRIDIDLSQCSVLNLEALQNCYGSFLPHVLIYHSMPDRDEENFSFSILTSPLTVVPFSDDSIDYKIMEDLNRNRYLIQFVGDHIRGMILKSDELHKIGERFIDEDCPNSIKLALLKEYRKKRFI